MKKRHGSVYLLFVFLLPLLSCGSDEPSGPAAQAPPPATTIQTVTLTTSDNITIATFIEKPTQRTSPAPTVIFIHGNNTDGKSEWVNSSLYNRLLEEGYIVAAFDIRTYGQSGSDGTQGGLLDDPNRAPRDLQAVVEFLRTDPDVDNARIGAIGSKLGAELACVGVGSDVINLRTAIGLSTIEAGVRSLSRNVTDFQLESVFYIAGANEGNGSVATNAQALFDATTEPRKITIVAGSVETGSALLGVDASLADAIVAWIDDTLK